MSLTPYADWTAATDTTELPRLYIGNPPTVEIAAPWLRPAPTPPARTRRVRRAAARFAAEFVRRDLADAWRESVIGRGLLYGAAGFVFLAAVAHGGHVLYLASIGSH